MAQQSRIMASHFAPFKSRQRFALMDDGDERLAGNAPNSSRNARQEMYGLVAQKRLSIVCIRVSLKHSYVFRTIASRTKRTVQLVSFEDALETFLERPTEARFLRVRELILAQRNYHPSPATLAELSCLFENRQFAELLDEVDALMPAWALCPRVHFLAGFAAEAQGDQEEVELRRFMAASCLQGILSTGDGSQQGPWSATYPSDARDCLAHMGLTVVSQKLMESAEGLLDVITASDGRNYHFAVGDLIAAGGEIAAAAAAAQP